MGAAIENQFHFILKESFWRIVSRKYNGKRSKRIFKPITHLDLMINLNISRLYIYEQKLHEL